MPPPLLQEQHPWWTIRDLNPWPPARQADALPAALIVHIKMTNAIIADFPWKCKKILKIFEQNPNFLSLDGKSRRDVVSKICLCYNNHDYADSLDLLWASPCGGCWRSGRGQVYTAGNRTRKYAGQAGKMLILGIDPGYAIVGYGLLEYQNNRFRTVDYGAITTPAGMDFSQRLERIYQQM